MFSQRAPSPRCLLPSVFRCRHIRVPHFTSRAPSVSSAEGTTKVENLLDSDDIRYMARPRCSAL